jgi:hypothetical protein
LFGSKGAAVRGPMFGCHLSARFCVYSVQAVSLPLYASYIRPA